ncbi:hypothetical protein D1092_07265 [Bartonella krasnovii]|uniref:Uncharacterized protein n=1 Tax=Bartonella krasnovii TaxID=2267275 RepID=A0A5B9D3Z4_9HYPH|nr:hypothetical protein D1092_07265 [Bartonella krasnovii]
MNKPVPLFKKNLCCKKPLPSYTFPFLSQKNVLCPIKKSYQKTFPYKAIYFPNITPDTSYKCAFFVSLYFQDKKGKIIVFLLTEDEKSYLMTGAVKGVLHLDFITK